MTARLSVLETSRVLIKSLRTCWLSADTSRKMLFAVAVVVYFPTLLQLQVVCWLLYVTTLHMEVSKAFVMGFQIPHAV